MRRALLLVAGMALWGCAHDNRTDRPDGAKVPGQPPPPPLKVGAAASPFVANVEDADRMVGKRVAVRGTAHRAKLGNFVRTEQNLMVVCLGASFPGNLIGQTVTAEGTLDKTNVYQATRGPNGEISQGTDPGTLTFTLQPCALAGTPN